MNKTSRAIYEINQLNMLALRDQWMNRVHPLVKFVLTLFYICMVISIHKYNVYGCLGMSIYPLAIFMLADLSFFKCIRRLWMVFPVIFLLGVVNPLFDKNMILLGDMQISAGFLSMFTLMMKAFACVLASYLLIATTTMEAICYTLRLLHVPKVLVIQVQLSYRYLGVLLSEVDSMMQAYSLRAPKQKGIHISTWGSLVGQLLLRSYDRASDIYESMQLRGFTGEYQYVAQHITLRISHLVYFFVWVVILTLFRIFPILLMVGNLVGRIVA